MSLLSRTPQPGRLLSHVAAPLRTSFRRTLGPHPRYQSTSATPSGRSPLSRATLLVGAAGLGAGLYLWSQTPESGVKTTDTVPPLVPNPAVNPKASQSVISPEIQANRKLHRRMETFVKALQKEITDEISRIDGKPFFVDQWTREEGGYGISCVLQDGNVFEKAGVNVSVIDGKLSRAAVAQMKARNKDINGDDEVPFCVAGISIVMHPHNPMVPTVHLNYRYFEIEDPDHPDRPQMAWFGGGSDLTPSYLFPEDATHFHRTLKDACDRHDPAFYPAYKAWCDRYFYLPHRQEARGVGGIFFDDLDDRNPEELFAFVQDCGRAFLPSYVPIVLRRKDMPFTEEQKRWQQLRRGRYVEFNLIHDRGTKFGLFTPGARIESILMSLPLTARWEYCHRPEPGTEEAKVMEIVEKPREWV
ncbi:Coproporphyrinogen-III oxidase [Tieghemiomyces parasiticus]|uniref:coproporphyrinogen oxidase n=1 Tax=Tieghemiomyces parasiticus TaxID=78921 RepID=A0A9W8AJ14_9FUNG|nr:Coproporphyrinogen-III oxidase [Tieghemiomyces parasiticus]